MLDTSNSFSYLEESIFEKYNHSKYFFFIDPPYDTTKGYKNEFDDDKQRLLSQLFKNTKSKCLMVVKDTPLMNELYSGYIVDRYPFGYWMKTSKNFKENYHLIIKNY